MTERESLLAIDIFTIDEFTNRSQEEFYSRDYLRSQQNHMRRFQPNLEHLLKKQPIFTPLRNRYFMAGAFATYDLIVTANYEHWTTHELSKDIINTTKRNFHDAYILDIESGIKMRGDRMVSDVSRFYEQLTEDSPTYAEWLQMRVNDVSEKRSAYDFIYGSLLTAMPFYYSREGERLAKIFTF